MTLQFKHIKANFNTFFLIIRPKKPNYFLHTLSHLYYCISQKSATSQRDLYELWFFDDFGLNPCMREFLTLISSVMENCLIQGFN